MSTSKCTLQKDGGTDREVSAKELRSKPGKIIEQVTKGVEVVVTVRGKRIAKIVPYEQNANSSSEVTDEIFGLWRNRKGMNVDDFVRKLRRSRSL